MGATRRPPPSVTLRGSATAFNDSGVASLEMMNNSAPVNSFVQIACTAAPAFSAWLAESGGSVLVSTYQAHRLAAIGWDGRQTSLLMRQFDKPLGLALEAGRLAIAERQAITLLADAPQLAPSYREDQPGRYDALYLPRVTYHTGELHAHDLAFQGEELLLVNTRYSCLARLSADYNFEPVWQPSFISELAPEDRCHLNGLAMRDGQPRYVTALGASDTAGGWRPRKADGGILIDVAGQETIVGGLSMPHSPRWYDGQLWLLNSGEGQLLRVDVARGQTEVVCALPGYLRGLAFVGPYALVGLCKIREKHIFGGLPVQQRHDTLQCGVAVLDLRRGSEVGRFTFTAGCDELYDVQFLSGRRRVMLLNHDQPAVRQAMIDPAASYWLRPSAEIPAGPAHEGPARALGSAAGTGLSFDHLLPESGTQL